MIVLYPTHPYLKYSKPRIERSNQARIRISWFTFDFVVAEAFFNNLADALEFKIFFEKQQNIVEPEFLAEYSYQTLTEYWVQFDLTNKNKSEQSA